MNTCVVSQIQTSFNDIDNPALVSRVVDVLYAKMLDDYRINRFFFTRPLADQAEALKGFVNGVLDSRKLSVDEFVELLSNYFTVAFARTNAKPSLVTGNDFGFLLDIVGGQDIRPIALVCHTHSYLMKLLPEDEHYDIVMKHLAESLQELGISGDQATRIMAFGESGRNALLGRGVVLQSYE